MSLKVNPLSPALGAEIIGARIQDGFTAAAFEKLQTAFRDHLVLLFRDQSLSDGEHEDFARLFRDLESPPSTSDEYAKTDSLMYVANRSVGGKKGILPDGEMQFHADQSYYEVPSKITTLYSLEIPEFGGNTLFLNSCAAYDALDDEMKARIETLVAEHVYDYEGSPTVRPTDPDPAAPRFVHPLVTIHPESGARLIYANRLFTMKIVGIVPAESDALLEFIFDHVEQPQFIFEHEWRVGDLVMWDNMATMHARRDFDPAETRILRRVCVRGERPRGVVG